MSHTGLPNLLGVRAKPIYWERPPLFFAALFCSDLSRLLIQLPSLDIWLDALLTNLLLAVLAALAFRWLPRTILALAATTIGYVVLSTISMIIIFGFKTWDPTDLLRPLLFLGAVHLAARRLKQLWLALFVGPVVGMLAHKAINTLFAFLNSGTTVTIRVGTPTTTMPDSIASFPTTVADQIIFESFPLLFGSLIFALVLWGSLRLRSEEGLIASRAQKGFYLSVGLILAIVLEFWVLASINDTKNAVSGGGDIIHNRVGGLPLNINGEERRLPKGTYVVTHQGPELLPWYWVYEYSYLTVPLPIVATLILVGLYFRSAKHTRKNLGDD